jgi:hypothetical protein
VSAIVFHISGHGFGHASRQIEVIHALAARLPHHPIIVRTAVSPSLLSRSITVPHTVLEGPCDTGIRQRDSVTHDDEATVRDAMAFHATWPDRVNEECRRITHLAPALIVGDIPPLAFAVADRLGVPSVAIANFTWDWIYEWYPELRDAPGLLDGIRAEYAKASLALRLPLSHSFDMFPRVEDIPLIARRATRPREETRRLLGLPQDRRVALLSFGGYGLQRLNVAGLDCLDTWTVILTDRIASTVTAGPSVVFLPEQTFTDTLGYEDLVAAVDVVATKPGYGILSECAAAGTAVLYTSRGRFREYDVLVEAMPSLLRSRYLSQEALFAGQWNDALEDLMAQRAPSHVPRTDGAEVAADALVRLMV